jgi:pyruvate formate lyase activating enzyme
MTMTTGIIFDIKRYAIHDGPGIRTTVFLKGCPLACGWCHNPEGIGPEPFVAYQEKKCLRCGACVENCPQQALRLDSEGVSPSGAPCISCFSCVDICPAEARERIGREVAAPELFVEIKKEIPFYDTSGGGVTFSGGEPLMQAPFLIELLELCGGERIHRAVDTTGHASHETMAAVAEQTDLFLYDLKIMDPEKHKKYTGVSNRLILDNLRWLAEKGVELIVRIPLIPGVNDDPENLDQTGSFLHRLPAIQKVDILPYHDFQKNKYRRFGIHYTNGKATPPSGKTLSRIKEHMERFGLKVAIGG